MRLLRSMNKQALIPDSFIFAEPGSESKNRVLSQNPVYSRFLAFKAYIHAHTFTLNINTIVDMNMNIT